MATDLLATVLSDFEFCTADGTTVCMRKNEQVLVLEKTNNKWWKVVRSGQQQPFYAPAANLQERTVPRVRLRSGTGSVRDRRRAPLSAVDAERHISGHEESSPSGAVAASGGSWGGWQGGTVAGSPVARSSSMDDVLAESPSRSDRSGFDWHRRQSWAPERHGEGRPVAGGGPTGQPEVSHRRSRSYQQEELARTVGSEPGLGSGGWPRPGAAGGQWAQKGPPPMPPGASSTWERVATTGPRVAGAYGASNTWERSGRAEPQFAPPESSWERQGTSGPVGPSGAGGGSRDQLSGAVSSVPHGANSTWERQKDTGWERGKDIMRVRGPMAMSWQTDRKQAPVPPPRTRHALPGMTTGSAGVHGDADPGSLPVSRGGTTINQSAPSLAFDAIDSRRPSASSLAVRRPSPSSLSDLRALRPDLSDGHNEGYRRTAERLAGRSESPRPLPTAAPAAAVVTVPVPAAGTGERTEGLWMPAVVTERPLGRPEETGHGPGSGRPVVPPRPGRRPAQAAAEQQKAGHPQSQSAPVQVDRSPAVPPVPHILETPRRQLTGSWAEYALQDGTAYFYNVETGLSSWQPPREETAAEDRELMSSCESLYSESESCSDSPLCSPRLGPGAGAAADLPLPDGWRRRRDTLGQFCFVRDTSPTRWYSGLTADDHVYFFAEGSAESQWSLPPALAAAAASAPLTDGPAPSDSSRVRPPAGLPLPGVPPPLAPRPTRGPPPPAKPRRPAESGGSQPSDLGSGWPQLRAGEAPLQLVIRQGTLSCRIKLSRRKGAGVKQVKLWRHWAPCHLTLTDSYLLLFTDVNDPASIRWGSPDHQPVATVHLAGASLITDSTASSKKNVLQLTTRHGMQVLLRDDSTTTVKVWSDALQSAISELPSELKPLLPPLVPPKPQPQQPVHRSPTLRRANDANSHSASESDSGAGGGGSVLEPPAGLHRENSRIRRRLKGFFSARPSPEELKRSGILKDERVFGRSLTALCEADRSPVPRFVELCIEAIESEPGSLRTEGLYRVSAGLDQIQRLRCQVDQENYSVLCDEPDPHVLAGALKLFFRELPQPLLPAGDLAEAALRAAETAGAGRQRTEALTALVASLEPAHRSTLQLLLRHLTKVTAQEASNRMGARNLAVVFGPTLTRRPEGDPLQTHTADVMRQNVLVEALILDFSRVFPAAAG